MKKIPSVFQRDPNNRKLCLDLLTAGCEWWTDGEGTASVKWDGTSCMVRDGKLYKRYDRKGDRTKEYAPGTPDHQREGWLWKVAPEGWEPAQEPDQVTGHWPGWLPVGNESDDKYHREAWERSAFDVVNWTQPEDRAEMETDLIKVYPMDGTYELIGRKVQGNPYGLDRHMLIMHGIHIPYPQPPREFAALQEWFQDHHLEGYVWKHPDGRMCKVKRRDFGLAWPDSKLEIDLSLILP